MTAIDISEETNAICAKLGLQPHMVSSLTIGVTKARAEIYLPNENGNKYIDDTGRVAVATKDFEVTT